jgi:hypothetical protein
MALNDNTNHDPQSTIHPSFAAFLMACNTLPDTVESCFQLRQLSMGLGSLRKRTLFALARLIRTCVQWPSNNPSTSTSASLPLLTPYSTTNPNDADWFAHRFSSVLLRPSAELSVTAVHAMKVCAPVVRALLLRLVNYGDYILRLSKDGDVVVAQVGRFFGDTQVPRLVTLCLPESPIARDSLPPPSAVAGPRVLDFELVHRRLRQRVECGR